MVQYSQIRRNIADFSKRFPSDSDAGTKINVDVASNNFVLHAERKPTGQTSGNLKLKDNFIFSGKRYNLSTTVKTGDVQELSLGTNLTDELEVRVGAVARTPVINKEGRVTDNAGASFGVTYNTRKCGLATDVKYIHQKDIQLELSTACQYKQFILGGKTKFNVQEQDFGAALKNLEVGARGDFDRYSTYMVLSDEFNGVKGGVEYKMDNNDLVFAESEYSLNSKNNDSVKLAVGLEKRLASGAVASVRLTDKFELGASYKARVNENLVATVAASVDAKNANTSKVGLDLNFHF